MAQALPSTMKALVLNKCELPLQLQTVPTPQATHGSVIIKVISTVCDGILPLIFSGTELPFTFPLPLIPGSKCVGRVAQVGPDTTSLSVGQLVVTETFLRARDDPTVQALWGISDGPTPQSRKWVADNWASGPFAEYVRAPLENTYPLNEAVLCGQLGYTPQDLVYLSTQLIPYGGFASVGLKPGERVIIAPATGNFSGAAVPVALALGANIVAVGRSLEVLKRLQAKFPAGRVQVVQTTGDVEADARAMQQWGPVDVYLDISPPAAAKSIHIRSAFQALKPYGRVCLMGNIHGNLDVPYDLVMWKSLTIRGQFMYEREDMRSLIRMAEAGVLKLGKDGGAEVKGDFRIEDHGKLLEEAAKYTGAGQFVVLSP